MLIMVKFLLYYNLINLILITIILKLRESRYNRHTLTIIYKIG